MVEQAIQMALLPPVIYHKMQEAFKRYENGTLKGKKGRVMEGLTLQKAIEGKLAPKLHQFNPIVPAAAKCARSSAIPLTTVAPECAHRAVAQSSLSRS